MTQMQRAGCEDGDGRRRIAAAGQDIEDDCRRAEVLGERLLAGGLDGIESVRRHRRQDRRGSPSAAFSRRRTPFHSRPQFPFLERRAIGQGTRYARPSGT